MTTIRLSVAQAIVRYLAHQYTERDGVEQRFIPGMFGIFGHGNVAGIGQALLQHEVDPAFDEPFEYWMGRNEQGMVHVAAAFAKQTERLQTLAVTSSIGPGALNMVTGAALATTNRVPVLLFPSDIFANRMPDPVLQQVEDPTNPDVSANDAFRPVSKFWDRVNRPEQLMVSLPRAMRVLTDPADTGAAVVCMPEDVQAEVYDWPEEFFAKKVWHIDRRVPDRAALARAVEAIRAAKRPWSSPAAAPSTPAPPRSCAPSPRPPASRSPTRRPARAASTGTTSAPSAAWAPRAPAPPTRSPSRRTSSSASAPATPTSPPARRPSSRTPTSSSSTSTSAPSTRPSRAPRCSSPMPARRSRR